MRTSKSRALADRFGQMDAWKKVWFSDEAKFSLRSPSNSQNERIYREVTVKTDILSEDLLVEYDNLQPSVFCYGAVSFYGKTELRFIEGFASDQEHLPCYRRKRKTVNQNVYCEEMCTPMFRDIENVMEGEAWTWQQDGAKAHTARATVDFLRKATPDFIEPEHWPSKSPDLNVMDYCIWSLLLTEIQKNRSHINTIDELKLTLLDAWDNITPAVLRTSTEAWIPRLRRCHAAQGSHFEHL